MYLRFWAKSVKSIIKFIQSNLNLFKLFKKLLQLHFTEIDFFTTVDIVWLEFRELSFLDWFTIFPCLLISLKVKCELKFRGSSISLKNSLLTWSWMIENSVSWLDDMTLVQRHVHYPVEILKYCIWCNNLPFHGHHGCFLFLVVYHI